MESRSKYLSGVRSIVVKLGTQLLSDKEGRLDSAFIAQIAEQVVALRQRKLNVTIVSSGAIGAGLRELNIPRRPTDVAKLQAIAAVGQRRLMDVWAAAFAPHKIPVAQILLTREEIDERVRFLNVRNTIHAVHELGAVPIINENDTISTYELTRITFGDNDILAALVTQALRADLLVLLSVVDGVLDADGKPLSVVESVEGAKGHVREEMSSLGKGGMGSKLESARVVTGSGEAMIIANGRTKDVLLKILDYDEIGTLFPPSARKRSARSRWIGSAQPSGSIVVDDGAVAALARNKSLLPAGIVKVEGTFKKGDVIAIRNSNGSIIARGLTNFVSSDVDRIRGKKTGDVRALLGEFAYDEVIHRDNLVREL